MKRCKYCGKKLGWMMALFGNKRCSVCFEIERRIKIREELEEKERNEKKIEILIEKKRKEEKGE